MAAVRAEVCFGQRAGAAHFTRMCLPKAPRQKRRAPRFAPGERVACAVEDATSEYSDWAAGTVLAVDGTVEEWAGYPEARSTVPYRVGLDGGGIVLVHRDEHVLIRELALQPAGRRVGADGSRCLGKFARRRADGDWQVVDHATRKVRKMQPEELDDAAGCCEHEQEEGRCGGCRAPPLEPPLEAPFEAPLEAPLEAPRPPSPPQLECCDEKGCGGCSQPPSEHEAPPQRPERDGEPSPPPPGDDGLPPPNPV